MYNTSQARLAINARIKEFTGIQKKYIQWKNQKDFTPPNGLWCRVTIQYSGSVQAGFGNGALERDFGIINIQCFSPKGTGDISVILLADNWRDHFKGWVSEFVEVYQTHAPTDVNSPFALGTNTELQQDYVMSLVRVDFRVN